MRNIVISFAAVVALSAIAAPAAAQQSAVLAAPQAQDNSGSASAAQAPRARAAADGDRVVCMRINPGASRITRRICRTQAEWQARGGDEVVDPR